MSIVDRLAVARGDKPADLILRNAQLVNVITGEIYQTDIVIHDEFVTALGNGYEAENEIDLNGKYVCPGLIDAHVHIESSLCTPPEFAKAVVPHGVTTIAADPHEIANVLGLQGINYMLESSEHIPMDVFIMASSCVPATHMETSGATLEADDLAPLLNNERVPGLAEVMNFPGVVFGDEGMLDKLELYKDRVLDGHCPGLTGKQLNAYVAAGIMSEHECTTVEEATEKLRLGMTILIREGTTTRNLKPLLPMVTPENHHYLCFCTDDRIPASLVDDGSIDYMVRVAIQEGIDPILAIRMGTINTAKYFRMYDRGVIAPSKRADMVVFSDINNLQAEMVFKDGKLVAENGSMVAEQSSRSATELPNTMNLTQGEIDFSIPADGEQIRVIGAIGDQVVTGNLTEAANIKDGFAVSDVENDILKMATLERHHASGKIGKGFIKGFGLKRGAIAGTVGHDHHNLIVIGVDDASMKKAVEAVVELKGGLVAVDGDEVLATLPLPVAGLMSDEPMETVRQNYDVMIAAAHELGSTLPDPMMTMSFMGLEVIPSLKLTDIGLVDVEKFEVVDLFV